MPPLSNWWVNCRMWLLKYSTAVLNVQSHTSASCLLVDWFILINSFVHSLIGGFNVSLLSPLSMQENIRLWDHLNVSYQSP